MNHNEAGEILRASVAGLAEPLKSAIEFTLTNFYQPSAAVEAKNFLSSVPYEVFMARDLREKNPELKAKIDAAYYTLQNDRNFWLSLDDLPHEQWRDIRNYEGLYQVSNYGRIKSFRRNEPMIFVRHKDSRNYFSLGLKKCGVKTKTIKAHQLVALTFIPNPESKPQVNHIDGKKWNNRVGNLEWVTSAENIKHAYDSGFYKVGAEHPLAKFTEEQVRYIREVCIPGDREFGMSALAKKLGVSVSAIEGVYKRETYKNVT